MDPEAEVLLPGSAAGNTPVFELPPECVPDFTDVEIEDGKPVDGFFGEKQYRLLTEPLYSTWTGPGEGKPFLVMANVCLFYKWKEPALVPDVMLSLDVQLAEDFQSRKEHNTYVVWEFGKAPDVVIEIVSDRRGGEADLKLRQYARIGIPYYAIFDPKKILGAEVLRSFVLLGREYQPRSDNWFPDVRLGLKLWEGSFEETSGQWLRWCDQEGQVIPTGRERMERLEAQLRALGVEPEA
jgi:hypothetical protein